jgi:hypothetical protein
MLSSGNAQIRTEAEWTETRTTLLLYRILGATPETVTPPPKVPPDDGRVAPSAGH